MHEAVDIDVVVVGAGLAGLRCAADLVAAGRDVVVLEARDRVGGRVHSHRFGDGQWCERGAEFVCTAHTEVLSLVVELGLEVSDVPSGGDDAARVLDLGGRTVPFGLHHTLGVDLRRWDDLLAELARRIDLDALDAPGSAELDARPVSELVDAAQLGLVGRVAVGRAIRTEYMLGPDEVSQLMAAWVAALHERSGDGLESLRIVGGNDQLATGLAGLVQSRIRLSSPVAGLDPERGVVTLRSGEVITARHVVAAVPLPVLGRVWPAMPAPLGRVGYGIGGKASVQVARRIWRDQGRDGTVLSDRSWGELWETTDGQAGDAGVLTALLSSHDGAAMAALPDAIDRIVADMDRIFPGVAGLAGERVLTDWTNDPWSLGAYACFGPGQLLAALPMLHAAHGKMLLAGEHTDVWIGYMEGALRSGRRAARRIMEPPGG